MWPCYGCCISFKNKMGNLIYSETSCNYAIKPYVSA